MTNNAKAHSANTSAALLSDTLADVPLRPLYCIAHRGGSGPENSLAAIRHSLELGVDAIEIDVWWIADQLWVTHDRRLGNQLPGNGRLLDQSLDTLTDLRLENGETIPTLSQVLELVAERCVLNIELKGPDCAPAVCRLLQDRCAERPSALNAYVISSFDHWQLQYCLKHLPSVKRGVLIEGIPLDYARCCDALQAYSFHPHLNFLNAELVADAHRRGLVVYSYTANHLEDWQYLQSLNVDGAFTDYPNELLAFNKTIR